MLGENRKAANVEISNELEVPEASPTEFKKKEDLSLDSILFYNPKIVETIDDREIFDYILELWPGIEKCETEKEERKLFLQMLMDAENVYRVLDRYHCSMRELIGLFYRKMPYLFATKTYILKIREIVEENYADE